MTTITIPPEALEAAAKAIAENLRTARLTTETQDGYKPEATAAIRAALENWPGWEGSWTGDGDTLRRTIILPLNEVSTQEKTNG